MHCSCIMSHKASCHILDTHLTLSRNQSVGIIDQNPNKRETSVSLSNRNEDNEFFMHRLMGLV